MQEKQVPWWRKALHFALGGLRSAFGLFARQHSNGNPRDEQSIAEGKRTVEIELYREDPEEEETELTENPPTPEEIVVVNPEAQEPLVEAAADEAETTTGTVIERADQSAPTQPEPSVATETLAEPAVALEAGETPGQSMAEEFVEIQPEGIDEVGEPAQEEPQLEPQSLPCANEGVDEASLLAESASTGEATPEFPEPDMNLDQSNREQASQKGEPEVAPEQTMEVPEAVSGTEDPSQEVTAADAADSLGHAEAPEPSEASSATQPAPGPDVASTTQPGNPAPVQQGAAEPAHAKHFIKLEGRDKEGESSPFSVVVSQVYDGPLDLLLDLIRKQDIDIYDIPIARITAQFLAYVNQLKATDVDVAGEFIYTASLLIHIKSKMLLPRAPAGPDDQVEDPRRELVERLLEHERFKNAAQMLQQKQMLEAATWTNPGIREFREDVEAEPEIAADTVDLVRVFRDILERARNRPVLNLQEDSVTVGQMIQFLGRRLNMEDKPVALRRLLSHTKSERALIAMFLALLELVRLQAILLRQDRAFSEIFIKKNTEFDSVMNEGMANARDDWR